MPVCGFGQLIASFVGNEGTRQIAIERFAGLDHRFELGIGKRGKGACL